MEHFLGARWTDLSTGPLLFSVSSVPSVVTAVPETHTEPAPIENPLPHH